MKYYFEYQRDYTMNVNVEIYIGEFFDKLTILEIKKERISDEAKLVNVNNELNALNELLDSMSFSLESIQSEINDLKETIEKIWEIKDDIRDKEAAKEFDAKFIELAESIGLYNSGSIAGNAAFASDSKLKINNTGNTSITSESGNIVINCTVNLLFGTTDGIDVLSSYILGLISVAVKVISVPSDNL